MKCDKETLEWVILLLQQVQAGGELRFMNPLKQWVAADWTELAWTSGRDGYRVLPPWAWEYVRVLPPWAWEYVEAERAGKELQVCFADGWQTGYSRDLVFKSSKDNWRIKEDSQPAKPVRTPLTAEQMRALVGTIADDGYLRCVVTAYRDDYKPALYLVNEWWTADELLDETLNEPAWTIDGKPPWYTEGSDGRT